MFTTAILRQPAPNFADGLTTSTLGRADYATMMQQHAAYRQALQALGLQIVLLEPLPDYPDAYFVEDVAVVTPHVAVITHPGAPARQGEAAYMQPVLAQHRPTFQIEAPGTVDGGDVLMVDNHFFIGLSDRTNEEGAQQLGLILEAHGHTFTAVPVSAGLHLKSSVNYVGQDTLLLTAEYAQRAEFAACHKIVLDPDETYAGNTLLVNNTLIMPQGYPKTYAQLTTLGMPIIQLDTSEAHKMDGGLTCMSLRF